MSKRDLLDAIDVCRILRIPGKKRPGKKPLPTPDTPVKLAPRPCHRGHVPWLRYVSGECVQCFADRRAEQLAISARRQKAHRVRRREALRVRGSHTAADIAAIFKAQRGRCGYCREPLPKKPHVDHIVPLALGGDNTRRNLQLLCPDCNHRKGAKHPLAYAARIGRLL